MSRLPSAPSDALHTGVTRNTDQGESLHEQGRAHSGAALQASAVDRSTWSRSGPEVWTTEARNALATDFRATLQQGVHGLCFSPYLEGQQPGSQVSEAQIRERLRIIQPHVDWVRTFSCTDGHEQTPRVAHELGLKTLVGAWLGTDAEINEREIQGVIDVARAGHADIVAVGNEVMLREDMSEDALLGFIQRVKDALPGVPVGYVDAYFLFEKHPRITAACDVVMTNCYPFWEGCPREQALAYMQTMVARTRAAAPGKRVLISETGWPDQGSAFQGSVPSREGAMQYFVDTCRWAREDGVEVFYFSAFDEAWKVGAEGDVGAYWGLWDAHGRPKFQDTDKDGELKFA
jgi:glucan 1,3-beta-glucosidase